MRYLKSLLVFICLSAVEPLSATMPCYHNQAMRDILRLNNGIQKVAVYGAKDGRETEDEYAASHHLTPGDVRNRYAATGMLNCKGKSASAQLTLKDNIITTVAHVITDPENCEQTSKPNKCEFVYRLNGYVHNIPVDSLIAQGFRCPSKHDPYSDWAVMRLISHAEGVTPYQVPTEGLDSLISEKKVVGVAGTSVDFQRTDKKTGEILYPKHIEDCSLKKIYGRPAYYFGHACSSSLGASGGSILERGTGTPVLLGIFASGAETVEQAEQAKKSGKPNIAAYDERSWSSSGVPVNRFFLEAILSASKD